MERHRKQGREKVSNGWALEESKAHSWVKAIIIKDFTSVTVFSLDTRILLGIKKKSKSSYLMTQTSHHLQWKSKRSHDRFISDQGFWTECMKGI